MSSLCRLVYVTPRGSCVFNDSDAKRMIFRHMQGHVRCEHVTVFHVYPDPPGRGFMAFRKFDINSLVN